MYILALYLSKLAAFTMRLLGKRATYLPGEIALKVCPKFLGKIGRPQTVVCVTGTNGKTTVCNMICDILRKNGIDPANNNYGSNIASGIASALLQNSDFFGRAKKQLAVLEVDERSSLKIYPYLKPDFVVCTNLFRDSIKRNAHTEFISYVINSAMPKTTKLILNGDDIIASGIGSNENPKVYFGIERLERDNDEPSDAIRDIINCPVCDTELTYDFSRYNHIGRVHCKNCGFKSPDIDYLVTKIGQTDITISYKNNETTYNQINDNIVNIYNMAAAIALLREIGINNKNIISAFEGLKPVQSRFSSEVKNGIEIIMQLAKGQNPIACSRVFDYIARSEGDKAVLLNLDDRDDAKYDSENVTWLYDCDYTGLCDDSIRQIIVGGKRAHDQHLRLLMAGVPENKIVITAKESDTPEFVSFEDIDKIFVLYDIYTVDLAQNIKDRLKERLDKEVAICE
ncbi:MAG: hypothetical protein DBX47_01440 [Clostridiales bacterium]|nr:MAG: hypothetical protein DBX47_01440 [Clostridiales bacterium]